jgi:hypothetical protein
MSYTTSKMVVWKCINQFKTFKRRKIFTQSIRITGAGKRLAEYEKRQIDVRRANGDSYDGIATSLNRSKHAIYDYANAKIGQTKSTRRPKKLNKRQEGQIVSKASNSFKSLSTIKNELNLNVSKISVLRTIKKSVFLMIQYRCNAIITVSTGSTYINFFLFILGKPFSSTRDSKNAPQSKETDQNSSKSNQRKNWHSQIFDTNKIIFFDFFRI